MLFLLNCRVQKTLYEGATKTSEVNHIVNAEDGTEAEKKLAEYYEMKETPYYCYYTVSVNYCNEVIS